MDGPDNIPAPLTRAARFKAFARHVRRYLTVGIGSVGTDFAVLVLLTRLAGWSVLEANLISRPCGGIVSFTLNKLWTFERREARGTRTQLFRYGCVWLGAYGMSSLLVWVFSSLVGWSAVPSWVAAGALVNGVGFLLMRHWTFRALPPKEYA